MKNIKYKRNMQLETINEESEEYDINITFSSNIAGHNIRKVE